jgi:hypothetical protein
LLLPWEQQHQQKTRQEAVFHRNISLALRAKTVEAALRGSVTRGKTQSQLRGAMGASRNFAEQLSRNTAELIRV